MDEALAHVTLEKAVRLETIALHAGLTLWQVQELEGIAIKCVALFGAAPQSLPRRRAET